VSAFSSDRRPSSLSSPLLDAASSPPRLRFLDRLRGGAVVVMIEVHVTNALLATSLRHTQAFRVVDFVNGLVAPAFLFCAGYAAASGQHSLARDAKRSGVLVALGYLLHSSALLRADWSGFFQADVLQIMGISLMGVSVVARLAKKRAAVAWTAVAALCLLLAPASRSLDSASWAAALRPYLTDAVASQFPLLPWAGFVFGGAAAARIPPRSLATAGAVALGVAAVASLFIHAAGSPEAYRASPSVALTRLAIVALLAGVLTRAEAVSMGLADAMTGLLSRRSLLVYFVHIAVVYGTHPASLRSLVGPKLGWEACALVWVAVTAAMAALAAKMPRVKLY